MRSCSCSCSSSFDDAGGPAATRCHLTAPLPHHPTTSPPRHLFFDAFGTLLSLDRPFERLRANLDALGYPLPLPDVEAAMRQEFAYYVRHSRKAVDAEALRLLRLECAAVLLEAFRERGHALHIGPDQAVEALMGAIAFRLYADVLPALEVLAGMGLRMGLISNWDCSLPDILRDLGLGGYLGVIAVSALVGAEKPDAAIFQWALCRAGASPGDAFHVGDSYEKDVLGARSAGMGALLLDRDSRHQATDAPVVHDLLEVAAWIGRT